MRVAEMASAVVFAVVSARVQHVPGNGVVDRPLCSVVVPDVAESFAAERGVLPTIITQCRFGLWRHSLWCAILCDGATTAQSCRPCAVGLVRRRDGKPDVNAEQQGSTHWDREDRDIHYQPQTARYNGTGSGDAFEHSLNPVIDTDQPGLWFAVCHRVLP